MRRTAAEQSTERTATDERLRTERQRTDDELARTRAEHDEGVERMLRETRTRMDRFVRAALGESRGASTNVKHAEERARQDEQLASERAALERDIGTLLSREREETDERLLRERIRADAEIGSRDDFLAMVSHDLRGMLNGIAMSASLLTCLEIDDPARTALARESRRIERFVVRMNRLIGDLLDVARLESGKLEMVFDRDDPAELIQEAADSARPLAEAGGLTVSCHGTTQPMRARYDRERILQVLANLIGNAIKFTERGGRIDVSVTDRGDQICFKVADTGRGIPADKLERIFERFSQGPGADRTGLGLGLYISKRIVEAHGGRLWVESRPGDGSIFEFTLPAAPSPSTTR